jgi:hypothetical protein
MLRRVQLYEQVAAYPPLIPPPGVAPFRALPPAQNHPTEAPKERDDVPHVLPERIPTMHCPRCGRALNFAGAERVFSCGQCPSVTFRVTQSEMNKTPAMLPKFSKQTPYEERCAVMKEWHVIRLTEPRQGCIHEK